MMVGLPESTTIDEINTAKELIKLKPKMVRIYPVLVIKNTPLEKELEKEHIKPLTVVQAVEVCKEIVRLFHDKNIDIIRIDYNQQTKFQNQAQKVKKLWTISSSI